MRIEDAQQAERHLRAIGYYRLSGYWHAFRQRSGPVTRWPTASPTRRVETLPLDQFKSGTAFDDALTLYEFDKKLRLLALEGLEGVEIALRVEMAHELGRLDPFCYLRPGLLHPTFSQVLQPDSGVTRHHDWLTRHAALLNRSREDFIRHGRERYGWPLPIWMACQVWDFGTMSTLFAGLRTAEQDRIAERFALKSGRILASWLRSLNHLRNVCAHHARLWNRNIIDQAKLPPADEAPWVAAFEEDVHARARCFLPLRIVRHLQVAVSTKSTWAERMKHHLCNFPALHHLGIDLRAMGIPAGGLTEWEWPKYEPIKNPSAVESPKQSGREGPC